MVDAASQALSRLIYLSGETAPPPVPEEEEDRRAGNPFADAERMFDPYRIIPN